MTGREDMTIDEIVRKVKRLKSVGRIRTSVKGPAGVGDTLEGLLGLPRTSFSLPDWGAFEVKSHRKGSGSRMTLISLKPTILHGKTSRDLIREYGIESKVQGRLNFYNTMSGRGENQRGWRIEPAEGSDLLKIAHKGVDVAVTKLSELCDKIEKKAKNLILVFAGSIKEKGTEFFEYKSANLYKGVRVGLIPDLLRTGEMVFEWRMHLRPNGSVRDHGPGYRIAPKNLHLLYSSSEVLF